MNAFHDEDAARLQAYAVATLDALACWEVVAWQFHFLTCQKLLEMLLEEGHVDGIDMLVVVIARFIAWREFTVNIVIIEREALSGKSVLFKPHAEFLAESGLPT